MGSRFRVTAHRHRMLGGADAVAVGNFGNRNTPLHRRLQIDMIGADGGGDRQLELFCLGNAFSREIGRPEGCEITISASASSRSNTELGPPLSEVTINV